MRLLSFGTVASLFFLGRDTFVRYLLHFVCNRKFVVNMEKNEKMHDDKSSGKHKTTVNSATCDTKGGGKCGEKSHKTPEHCKSQK